MWCLQWKSKKHPFDNEGNIHNLPIPGMTNFEQKNEAREIATTMWKNICDQNEAIKFSYQNPQLVWQEPLIPRPK